MDGMFDKSMAQWCSGRKVLDHLLCLLERLALWNELVDEPNPVRLFRIDWIGVKHQFERFCGADDPGQPLRSPGTGYRTDTRTGDGIAGFPQSLR